MRLSLRGDQNYNPAVDHLVGGRLRLLRHRPHVRRAVRDPGSALLTGRQGGSVNELEDPPETLFKEKHGVWDPMPELTTVKSSNFVILFSENIFSHNFL
jgi:hypothetical protein